MNQAAQSCVLFSSDPTIVSDIKASLKLLEMEVRSAATVDEVQVLCREERPEFIFACGEILDGSNAAVDLAKSVKSETDIQTIPIVLLRGKDEPSYTKTEFFEANLILPVEFPTFTQQVRQLRDQFLENPLSEKTYDFGAMSLQIESLKEGVSNQSQLVHQHGEQKNLLKTLDKRMVVAYGVQLTVLEKLRSDTAFQTSALVDIPQVISRVTEDICKDLDIKELLGL